MQDYELTDIINNIPYLDRAGWEQHRFLVYSNVQMNSKKQIKPTDLLKFAWDGSEVVNNTTISNSDIERLKNKSKLISKTIING